MASRTKRTSHWRAKKARTTAQHRARRRAGGRKRTSTRRKARGVRAMWKGRVTFGSVELPVKLYAAVTDKSIHFRLLDAKHHEPVKQHMIDPESGDIVEQKDVAHAYETKSGEFVLLDDDELEAAEPKESRDVEILRFVDAADVALARYDRPYFLGPDGDSGNYFALARALRENGKEGIARWVMRRKEYVGALKAEGDYLVLITLRHAGEVVDASRLPAPGGRAPDKREAAMAKQLVDTMRTDGPPDLSKYRDTYRDRVLELVQAKAEGKVVKFPRKPRRPETKSLAAVLEKSLHSARRKSA